PGSDTRYGSWYDPVQHSMNTRVNTFTATRTEDTTDDGPGYVWTSHATATVVTTYYPSGTVEVSAPQVWDYTFTYHATTAGPVAPPGRAATASIDVPQTQHTGATWAAGAVQQHTDTVETTDYLCTLTQSAAGTLTTDPDTGVTSNVSAYTFALAES